jgi:two-component system, OmpR family, phosphate regulon sensor histidine kinase PhoR
MKNRLFWKNGLLYLLVLLLVLAVLDVYVVRALRQEHFDSAFSQLESVSHLALTKHPAIADQSNLEEWARWFGKSGIRVTLIADDGKVLADSSEDPAKMENHLARPEVKEAFLQGSGQAVRRSPTLGLDLVYLARRYDAGNERPLVIRLSLPVSRVEGAVFAFRSRLWGISLLILICGAGISLFYFRAVSRRIERINEF